MSDTVLVALISASGALVVGLTTVGLNIFWMARSFDQIRESISDLRTEMRTELRTGMAGVHKRLDQVDTDLKQFFVLISEHSTEIARLKDKTGLK